VNPPKKCENRTPPLGARRGHFATFLWGEKSGGGGADLTIAARPPPKQCFYDMDLQEEVKAHTRRVETGERVRYGPSMSPLWNGRNELFRMHDCRRRTFRLVLGRYIQVALSWIVRWRCLRCGKRFTDYPRLLPYPRKRFVKLPVLEKTSEYLGKPIAPTVRPPSMKGMGPHV